jgi:hypothetical protein
MFKDKLSKYLLVGGMSVVGLVAGIAGMAGAQVATTTTTPTNTTVTSNTTVDTPEPGDVADTPGVAQSNPSAKTHGHAPLGGDGVVASITGTTIVIGEESDEGGASYTVDASKATFTNNGVAGSLSDIKVGEKVFVQGTTNGTNVIATSVSVGHPGGHVEKAGDTDGTAGAEASEPAGSSTTSDQ